MIIRLAVNAFPLLSLKTGIQRYLYNLMLHVEAHDDVKPNYFYGYGWNGALLQAQVPCVRGVSPASPVQRIKGAIHRHVPKAHIVSRFFRQKAFNRKKRGQFDVYHEPNFVPYRFDGPTVITVHDLSFIRFPGSHPQDRVDFMTRHLPRSLARAQVVLTDSQFVKREIIEVYGVSADKIEVAYLGVSDIFRPMSASETQHCCARHGLCYGRYLLAVGTIEPRKNLVQVLRAYQDLPPGVQEQYPLVIVGIKGWHYSTIENEMAPLIRSGRVRLLGYVLDEELAQIYAGATALLYTSLYEGFGLPPLEGMASGVPIITSNQSSIPEVVSDAAIMVDPQDVEALKCAMLMVIEDVEKAQQLRELGIERAKSFSWERCAKATVAAYKRAAGV